MLVFDGGRKLVWRNTAPIDVLTIHLDGSMSVGNGRNRLYGEDVFRIFRPIPKE